MPSVAEPRRRGSPPIDEVIDDVTPGGGDDVPSAAPPLPPVPPEETGDGGRGDDDDPSPGGPWVTVATFWHPHEAHIARLRLESEGVPCLIFDEYTAAAQCFSIMLGGVKLKVPQSEVVRAAALLQRLARDAADRLPTRIAEYASEGAAKCAACVIEAEQIEVTLGTDRDATTLAVRASDLERAAVALRHSPYRMGLIGPAAAVVPCRICDSTQTRPIWRWGRMLGRFRLPLPVRRRLCATCGYVW